MKGCFGGAFEPTLVFCQPSFYSTGKMRTVYFDDFNKQCPGGFSQFFWTTSVLKNGKKCRILNLTDQQKKTWYTLNSKIPMLCPFSLKNRQKSMMHFLIWMNEFYEVGFLAWSVSFYVQVKQYFFKSSFFINSITQQKNTLFCTV